MQPFVTQDLPPSGLAWEELIPAIGRANRALARYDGVLYGVPNPGVLLSPLTTQEAVLSSRIEGTQASLGDVLKFEAGEEPQRESFKADIAEIINYRRALRSAEADLTRRPFSKSMLLGLHEVLLDSVRGQGMRRGALRVAQNWIGTPGCPIEEANFVPPIPSTVPGCVDQWLGYYHSDQPDALVQLAIVHAQFEIIHPFDDGNGRLGRLLIPLFLFEKRLLHQPTFYLSAWLEEHKEEYVARLRAIGREPLGWNQWCAFFLRGIEEQAANNAEKARAIQDMYNRLKEQVLDLTRSQFAVPLLDQLFERPIFQSSHLRFSPRAPSRPSLAGLLRRLREEEILGVVRESAGRRGAVYVFKDLVNLCEGDVVF